MQAANCDSFVERDGVDEVLADRRPLRRIGRQPRDDGANLLVERPHVGDQVLEHRQVGQRLERDRPSA